MLSAARHVDVYVLARQERGAGRRDVQFEHDRRVVVRFDPRDGGRELALRGLACRRRSRHRDHAVALRDHLAREHEAAVFLFIGQRVVDIVFAEVVPAAVSVTVATVVASRVVRMVRSRPVGRLWGLATASTDLPRASV